MYINENLLKEVCKENGKFRYDGERIFVQDLDVGALAVDDGTILFGDPYEINRGIRVIEGLAKGIYPVTIYSGVFPPHDEHKIFALKITLQDGEPDHFEMAMPQGMTAADFPGNEYCGVSTKSNNVTFMDGETCLSLISNVEDSVDLMKEMEDKISSSYFEMGGMADVKLPEQEKNFMTVVAGNDIGGYPIYFACKGEEKVAIIVDFLLIEE